MKDERKARTIGEAINFILNFNYFWVKVMDFINECTDSGKKWFFYFLFFEENTFNVLLIFLYCKKKFNKNMLILNCGLRSLQFH